MQEDFKEFFKKFNKDSCGQTLSKTPQIFFDRHGYSNMSFLIGKNYEETRVNIYEYVFGPAFCKGCGTKITRIMPGWEKGWYTTCSEICRQKIASERQKGDKNTSHKMSIETRINSHQKISTSMKEKIKNGTLTPKASNYKNQRPIKIFLNGKIEFVRSLWELIYRLNFPNLLYENKRIEYFDNIQNKMRIYITDFYDPETNTIIEIRPKAYQHLLKDKQDAVLSQGYNYLIVDEDYFNTQKTNDMISLIESVVCDFEDVRNRLKWLKKA